MSFKLNPENKYEIETSGLTDPATVTSELNASWATLATGFETINPTLKETDDNTQYYDGAGYGSSDITAKTINIAFSGNRIEGDAAQDFVAGKLLSLGDDLKSLIRWTRTDGGIIIFLATLTAIQITGGKASDKQTFSFTAVSNGKPYLVTSSDSGSGN